MSTHTPAGTDVLNTGGAISQLANTANLSESLRSQAMEQSNQAWNAAVSQSQASMTALTDGVRQVVEFGEFRLNLGTREMFRGDEPMPLTSGEFAVLKALVTNAREPMSRDKLMNMARGREYSAMERSIDVQISRLRRLVEEDPSKPRYIQTVWGLGYVFVPDGKAV